jgi:hypothetical protein
MKKFLFILTLLLPATLFAQQDKTKPIFISTLEKCNVTIAGKYHNKDTVPLSELQNTIFLKIDCGTFFGCSIYCGENGVTVLRHFNGMVPFNNVFLLASNTPNYSTLVAPNIEYRTSDGQIHHTKGITITVKK